MTDKKEAFVGKEDRPSVQINLDDPITSLRVRDLAALLAPAKVSDVPKPIWEGTKHFHKDFADSKFIVKDINDNAWQQEVKHVIDNTRTIPQQIGPEEFRQTVDALVKQVAQLQEVANQLKR